jgi:PPOX class probable F420-dependent enzyme
MPSHSADVFGAVQTGKVVLLTTFKRDGSGVTTPVWLAPTDTASGRGLLIWTERSSGKVKRIRNGARVQIASGTHSGKQLSPPIDAEAQILDDEGSRDALRAVRTRYGMFGRLWLRNPEKRLREGVGILVTERTTD